MLIGEGIGAGAGLFGGLIMCSGANDSAGISCMPLAVVVLTPITMLAGGVVGTLVGATQRADRFAPILLPTGGLGMSNGAGGRFGLTLGVQLRF
jgi:hypothetical protein